MWMAVRRHGRVDKEEGDDRRGEYFCRWNTVELAGGGEEARCGPLFVKVRANSIPSSNSAGRVPPETATF